MANLALIVSDRTASRINLTTRKSPNVALWWMMGSALVFLGLVLCTPALQNLFRFSFLHPIDLTLCFVTGIACLFWFKLLKGWSQSN